MVTMLNPNKHSESLTAEDELVGRTDGIGLAQARRKVLDRRARRRKVSDLFMRGHDYRTISEKTGVNYVTVANDIKALQRYWRRQLIHNAETLRAQRIRELDAVKAEAWSAWENSKKEKIQASKTTNGEGAEKTRVSRTNSSGDPQFLRLIMDAIGEQAAISGLIVNKVAPVDPSGEKPYTNAVFDEIVRLSEEVGDGVHVIDGSVISRIADAAEASMNGAECPTEE